MLDRNGRAIDYLRISLTDRCNLRCTYCMPEDGIDKKYHEDILRFEEIATIIRTAARLGITKIRLTGGEPLVLKDIEEVVRYAKNTPGIREIGMTTNGILLAEKAEALKAAGLDRVNISLDTLDADKFREITRGGDINKVLHAVDKVLSLDMKPVKINTVLMRGFNDDEVGDLMDLTRERPIQVRFIELMPLGQGEAAFEERFMEGDEILQSYPELQPTRDKSRVARVFRLPGAVGSVGFISPLSCKFCQDCNRIRLTSSGTIKPCLHSAKEVNLRPFLHDDEALYDLLKRTIYEKPKEHHLETDKKSQTFRMMFQIGG